jgi:hypothetical protein
MARLLICLISFRLLYSLQSHGVASMSLILMGRFLLQWTDPVLIMGSYDSQIVFFEPMIPYTFVNGTTL